MPRQAKIWWNKQRQAWCTELGGRRRSLAKGRQNRKLAADQLKALLREQELLDRVNGTITVARLCEEFLNYTFENRELATYKSYKYACQKFVEMFGTRLAHTIEPLDISRFAASLKTVPRAKPATDDGATPNRRRPLNDTSRGIVLRPIQRCFNWGVEMRLIPPHNLGRIRKPPGNVRDRYVTDEEFQLILRSKNALNGRRCGAAFRRLLLAFEWTGCRPGELVQLHWDHIRWDHNLAILAKHKTKRTGRPRVIPLIPKLKRLLRWIQAGSSSKHCWAVRVLSG
jgi:integrase